MTDVKTSTASADDVATKELESYPLSKRNRYLTIWATSSHQVFSRAVRHMPTIGSDDGDVTWSIFYHTDSDATVISDVSRKDARGSEAGDRPCEETPARLPTPDPGGLVVKSEKRRKLESAGWRVGDTREFLDLTPDESAIVEIKLALARRVRELREERN